MPEFTPFRAIRYAPDTPLGEVVAPPYDVISPSQREALIARHPSNFVHVSLPKQTSDGYNLAGQTFRRWLSEGVMVQDDEPAFYLYRADFTSNGGGSHAGIVGALELEPFGAGGVFPHEKTMPGPKADRLELMRTTQANLEALWFLAASHSGVVDQAYDSVSGASAAADVTDGQGVRHRFWRLPSGFDPKGLAERVVVADGHHRYETCLHYRDQMRADAGPGPWDMTLALIAEPGELAPALSPTHRLVTGLDFEDLADLDPQPFDGSLSDLADFVRERGPGTVGVATEAGQAWVRSDDDLDTAFIARRVVEAHEVEVRYEHSLEAAAAAVSEGATAFLLAPVSVETVIATALAGGRMPPKTTLFTPKPVSGGVVRSLKA